MSCVEKKTVFRIIYKDVDGIMYFITITFNNLKQLYSL